MLTCLSIQSATETANANIKKALLGYFTINAKTLENGIPEDTVSQILAMDGLSGRYTLRSYTYATYFDADGNLLEINTEGAAQVPEGYENAGRVVANSNSQEDSYFTDGGFEMVEGNPITTETGSQVLIHEKFAQRNGLAVGDTMLLGNVEDKDKTIPVTVAGIFTNTEEQDSIGMAPSYDLYDNIVFTDLSTASFLLYGTEGTTNVQYGDFYVNDPDELERIMSDVQELDGVDWESCTLTRYDNDYQNAKESLEGLQNIVFIAIAVVSVICFLVLALFLTLRLRGRIHETGVYLAMGISKGSVLLQYLLEVILVAAIALVISFGTSTAISHQIGEQPALPGDNGNLRNGGPDRGKRNCGRRTHRGFGSCRDRGGCFRRGLRTGVGFRHGVVCGLYRTGGLPDHEDEAQADFVADGVKEAQYEPQNEFRNTSDFIQHTEMEKRPCWCSVYFWLLPPWCCPGWRLPTLRRNRPRKSGEPPGPALPWRETYLLVVGQVALMVLIVRRNLYLRKCFRKLRQ